MDALGQAIELAVAPVFLLTAVAGMLNALGTRIARVIDRARWLQTFIEERGNQCNTERLCRYQEELVSLSLRSRIINLATALMVLCAVLIGATVMEIFYATGIAGRLSLPTTISFTFLGGFGVFLVACALYLAEILIASRSIKIGPLPGLARPPSAGADDRGPVRPPAGFPSADPGRSTEAEG